MRENSQKFLKDILTIVLTVVVCSLVIAGGIYASSTIGNNVSVGGTMSVTGNATSSANLVVGTTIWAAPTSTFTLVGSAYLNNKATTSHAFWIGTGGVANNINLDGGDLYVQDGLEIDGQIFVTGAARLPSVNATSSIMDSATTSDSFSIGGRATTTNNTVIGARTLSTGTTTITIGGYGSGDGKGVCFKFFSAGVTIWCYFDTRRLGASPTSTALICQTSNFSPSCE